MGENRKWSSDGRKDKKRLNLMTGTHRPRSFRVTDNYLVKTFGEKKVLSLVLKTVKDERDPTKSHTSNDDKPA